MVEIEPATMDDLDRVTDLWVALAEEQKAHDSHLSTEANRETIRSSMAHHVVDGGLVVAREDGRVVGFVSFEVEDDGIDLDVVRGRIQNVYVEPEERDRGIGSSLLDRGEAVLEAADVDAIVVEAMAGNEAARRLYRRRGYDPHRVLFSRSLRDEKR